MTKPELLDKITGLLGGRVAEEIVFGEVSTGAHNDFQRATGIARRMVTEFGMSDKLGPMQFGSSARWSSVLRKRLPLRTKLIVMRLHMKSIWKCNQL